MQMQWVPTCASLPHEGEPVQLLLHDRQAPMSGAYTNGVFRTRWAEYEIDRVRFWREADINPARAQSNHTNPGNIGFGSLALAAN